MTINLYNMDNMEAMAKMPDKAYDLAIIDPPYGLVRFSNKVELSNRICKTAKINTWDIKPTQEYFAELFRVSQYQIIWGSNNFQLPSSEYFIVWDKMQTVNNFASAELAYTNIRTPAKVFRYAIHKEIATRIKIHPTQKPIKLYEWLLRNYAKEGDKILDTHLGSGSIAIACHNMGFDLDAYELDKDYYEAAVKRLNDHKAQGTLFTPKQVYG